MRNPPKETIPMRPDWKWQDDWQGDPDRERQYDRLDYLNDQRKDERE